MKLKEEFSQLVKTAKENAKRGGTKLTNELIGRKLNVGGTYISGLLGGSKEVTRKHIADFKSHFKNELEGVIKPSAPGDELNRERAIIKVLYHEVAKLKAEKLGVSVDKVLDEMERDTMIAWKDLEGQP